MSDDAQFQTPVPQTTDTPAAAGSGDVTVGLDGTQAQTQTGTVVGAVAAPPGTTPAGVGYVIHQPDALASGVLLDAADHAEGHSLLAEAEQLALFWGGEVGTKLRNLVLRAREKFTA